MDVDTMISKIQIIPGDCSLERLGISDEDRKLVTDKVDLIYHCAASIRFDEKLKKAINLNTRGTLEMINLSLECKNLKVSSTTRQVCSILIGSRLDVWLHIDIVLPSPRELFAGAAV
jgi:thioester reductase-like protein